MIGYAGAFGYNLPTGVTIVVETTKSERQAMMLRRSRFFVRR
jgi:hypothetical protein